MQAAAWTWAVMAFVATDAAAQASHAQGRVRDGVSAQIRQGGDAQLMGKARERRVEEKMEALGQQHKKHTSESAAPDVLPQRQGTSEIETALTKAAQECARQKALGLVQADCRPKQ